MAVLIPDLWPDDLGTDVQSPAAILRAQESSLERKTGGKLLARLSIDDSGDSVQLLFDVEAPRLGGLRQRIMTATHGREMMYPVSVSAKAFRYRGGHELLDAGVGADQRRAATPEEFIRLVGDVFGSLEVRSLLASLIARINEQEAAPAGGAA